MFVPLSYIAQKTTFSPSSRRGLHLYLQRLCTPSFSPSCAVCLNKGHINTVWGNVSAERSSQIVSVCRDKTSDISPHESFDPDVIVWLRQVSLAQRQRTCFILYLITVFYITPRTTVVFQVLLTTPHNDHVNKRSYDGLNSCHRRYTWKTKRT